MLRQKSVWSVVLLSILTFGIYMLWWIYDTARALQGEGGYEDLPAAWLMLLCFFFSPVGGAFFMLSAYQNLIYIRYRRGLFPRDNSKILWLLLGILSPILTVGIVQYEINRLFDAPQGFGWNGSNFYNSHF